MKLIMFTTCKPMVGNDKLHQEQAIQSWVKLKGIEIKIIVFGNDYGVKEICDKYNLTHIPQVENIVNVPKVKAMFEKSASFAQPDDIMLWVNADIIFFQDLIINVNNFLEEKNRKNIKDFVLVGARLDWNNPSKLPVLTKEHFFGNIKMNDMIGNQRLVKTNVVSDKYECHPITDDGIDYIIHSPTTYKNLIDSSLVIAGCYHDSILMWLALQSNMFTCNLSNTVTAIHQNHGISEESRNREKNCLETNNKKYYNWLEKETKKRPLLFDTVDGTRCASANYRSEWQDGKTNISIIENNINPTAKNRYLARNSNPNKLLEWIKTFC